MTQPTDDLRRLFAADDIEVHTDPKLGSSDIADCYGFNRTVDAGGAADLRVERAWQTMMTGNGIRELLGDLPRERRREIDAVLTRLFELMPWVSHFEVETVTDGIHVARDLPSWSGEQADALIARLLRDCPAIKSITTFFQDGNRPRRSTRNETSPDREKIVSEEMPITVHRMAIVGSIGFEHPDLVREFVDTLPRNAVVISGGAPGVDTIAEESAKTRGLATLIFPADRERYGRAAGPIRNRRIVEEAQDVVAFWNGASRGTINSVLVAVELGKRLRIIGEDGNDITLAEALAVADKRGVIAAFRPADAAGLPEDGLIAGALRHPLLGGDFTGNILVLAAHFGTAQVFKAINRLDRSPPSVGWGHMYHRDDGRTRLEMSDFIRGEIVRAMNSSVPDMGLLCGVNAIEAYAFEIRPSFGGGVLFRIRRDPDGIFLWGYAGGRPEDDYQYQERCREITEDQWRSVVSVIERTGFWDLPPFTPPRGLDGEDWVVEGLAVGRRHRVTRWCPDHCAEDAAFTEVGKAFMALAGATW